jgi:uncharacterized Fe-S cluster protein YjdI
MQKKYSGNGYNIVWNPDKCIHSAICIKGLPRVFRRNERPWIDINGAGDEEIITQVKACPSGALSIEMSSETHNENSISEVPLITLMNEGPYLIQGAVDILMPDGTTSHQPGGCALCRCGKSAGKPFCDGSHRMK